MSVHDIDPRQFLDTLFRDTIAALQPFRAVHEALDALDHRLDGAAARSAAPSTRVHLIGTGKAAASMTQAALEWCTTHDVQPAGGVVITHDMSVSLPPSIRLCIGDHPVPAAHSQAAASQLGEYIDSEVHASDSVLVLLSGGTSALLGAPRTGLDAQVYRELCAALLTSGLVIGDLNLLRRRLSRWSGGRLGAALQARGATVQVLAMSDVIGDSLAAIGSGPCVPDRSTDAEIEAVVQRATLDTTDRTVLRQALRDVARDATPAAGRYIPHRVVSSNIVAQMDVHVQAALRGAFAGGMQPLLHGEARVEGEAIAHALLRIAVTAPASTHAAPRHICCWGGEPTVALPMRDVPPGGRMQALALAIARTLAAFPTAAAGITVLAAGSDGRDGTTDAAGAIVDRDTWAAIVRAGRDPAADLAAHRSHDALRAAGVLLPAFASGVNVNDLVIGCVTR